MKQTPYLLAALTTALALSACGSTPPRDTVKPTISVPTTALNTLSTTTSVNINVKDNVKVTKVTYVLGAIETNLDLASLQSNGDLRFNVNNLALNDNTVTVRAFDAAGNVATSSFKINYQPVREGTQSAQTNPGQWDYNATTGPAVSYLTYQVNAQEPVRVSPDTDGTARFTINPLPYGTGTITVRAYDKDGQLLWSATYPFNHADAQTPSVANGTTAAFIKQNDGTYAIRIEGAASDNHQLQAIEYAVVNSSAGQPTEGFQPLPGLELPAQNVQFNTIVSADTLSEGTYHVYLRVTDTNGSSSISGPYVVTINRAAPTINTWTPTIAAGSVTISGTTSSDATSVTYQITGGGLATALLGTATVQSGTFSTGALSLGDGAYSVTVTASNGLGATSTATAKTFTIDTTAPAFGTDGSSAVTATLEYVNGQHRVKVTGSVTDALSADELQLSYATDGGHIYSPVTPNWDGDLFTFYITDLNPFSSVAEGGNGHFKLRAVDASGNTSEPLALSFVKDTTGPVFTPFTWPSAANIVNGHAYFSTSAAQVSGTASDTSGVTGGSYLLNGSPHTQLFTQNFTLDLTNLTEGKHTVRVTARDAVMNENAHEETFTVDLTNPTLSALPSGWTNQSTLTLMATDANLEKLDWTLDGTPGSASANGTSASSGALTLNEGEYPIIVTARDLAKRVEEVTATLRVDRTAPNVTATPARQPDNNGWYAGDVTVAFTAADDRSGVAIVTDPRTVTSEGEIVLTGSATDLAGNVGTSKSLQIKLDKSAPVVSSYVVSPNNGAEQTITVTGSVTDAKGDLSVSGVQGVDVYINDNLAGAATVTDGTFSFKSDTLNAGTYSVKVIAHDRAGNRSAGDSATVNIAAIDSEAPQVTNLVVERAGGSGNVKVRATITDNVAVKEVWIRYHSVQNGVIEVDITSAYDPTTKKLSYMGKPVVKGSTVYVWAFDTSGKKSEEKSGVAN